ncbi:MAG: DinB family protein [Bacteroidota bacterium]
MRQNILLIGIIILFLGCSKNKDNTEVKSLLADLMKKSHTEQHWFVPTKTALEGLAVEQSNWRDSTENHSIGELVSHLVFWNGINLRAFNGEDMTDFEVDNETTFKMYTENEWVSLVNELDSIQTEWESIIVQATDEQLAECSKEIANIQAHNAYHAGQIIYIRKRNGWWNKK